MGTPLSLMTKQTCPPERNEPMLSRRPIFFDIESQRRDHTQGLSTARREPQSATMLAPRTGRMALERAICSSATSTVTLPGFLVPAFQTATTTATASTTTTTTTTVGGARRNFSATTARASKLGRTPLTIPPGVELSISDLFVKKDMTSYMKTYKRKVTVTGPLGETSQPARQPADQFNFFLRLKAAGGR